MSTRTFQSGTSAGGTSVTVSDEGVNTGLPATDINFVGAGVTASGAGGGKTVTIPGGGTASISATAAEDLTVGDMVGISNGVNYSVAKTSTLAYYVNGTGINPPADRDITSVSIDIDKVAYIYRDGSTSELKTFVATYNTSDFSSAATLGTRIVVSAGLNASGIDYLLYDLCKLDTNKYAIVFRLTASPTVLRVVAASVVGTVVTLGAITTVDTSAVSITTISMNSLGTDKVIIAYGKSTGTTGGVVVCTFAGLVVTAGVRVNFSPVTGVTHTLGVGQINTDKFLITYADATTSIGYMIVGTVVGTVITLGVPLSLGTLVSSNGFKGSVLQISPDVALVTYANTAAQLVVATVTGTTIALGTSLDVGNGNFTTVLLSPTEAYVSDSTAINKITITGTVLTAQIAVNYTNAFAGQNSKQNVDAGGYYIQSESRSNGQFRYWIQGMSNQFVGVAQATVLKGATLNVIISGVDSNQSGLTPGSYYSINLDSGSLLTEQNPVNGGVSTFGDIQYVRALSDTDIVIV